MTEYIVNYILESIVEEINGDCNLYLEKLISLEWNSTVK